MTKNTENARETLREHTANYWSKQTAETVKRIADNENALERWSTGASWEQYQRGEIGKAETVKRAQRRAVRKLSKQAAADLDKLSGGAGSLNGAVISVTWTRSRVWGYNPTAVLYTPDGESYTGRASGCGYDKESAAIADALNQSNAARGVLYNIKGAALLRGESDESRTACAGIDNRNCVGYGAGYGVVPYYESGVGVNCFWAILERGGYSVRTRRDGKRHDIYTITKKGAEE